MPYPVFLKHITLTEKILRLVDLQTKQKTLQILCEDVVGGLGINLDLKPLLRNICLRRKSLFQNFYLVSRFCGI